MKTLIFNGSPRRNGDTEALINELTSCLNGDIKQISLSNNISVCTDCRYCWENIGCVINDEMQEVYKYLEDCDNVVVASPIWFSSLSGPLLNLASRLQMIFAARHFKNTLLPIKEKSGAIILAGAQPETAAMPLKNARTLLKLMNVNPEKIELIEALNTDITPAKEDSEAIEKCRRTARIFNYGV